MAHNKSTKQKRSMRVRKLAVKMVSDRGALRALSTAVADGRESEATALRAVRLVTKAYPSPRLPQLMPADAAPRVVFFGLVARAYA